jgi:precorrin-2 dehydrogenase/sirohydrochlorin ferrochelatase
MRRSTWPRLSPVRRVPNVAGAPADGRPAMFPLMLDITRVPVMVIGGAGITVRVAMLDEYGASDVHVFAAAPEPDLVAAAHKRLTNRWPTTEDFARIKPHLVFVADVDDATAAGFRDAARAAGAFVHVQDRIALCDFHLPARLRRGHLQVTVSTDGAAAGLSRLIREHLEAHVFGPEWAERVTELAAARQQWKAEGLSMSELARTLAAFVAARGWLKNL